ncbi:zinc finger HIT domain-containing protein 2 [Cocos nucifera]|uniref:Zinc finger HIT domain-containing protein 2 n=1 Tax=Cocos nucifera TaxID=13894 RepID=A0A8K0IFK6_COCNU|nr:zinc finger HIT domain-containing protein 2 [Cocos nucifera]
MHENVMEELRQMQPEDETKRKMLDILKRFHSEEEMNSDDEDESMISEETIQKVLSGNEIRLEDLSAEEIKYFRKALASGELSRLIEPWTPWWTKPSARSISLSPGGRQLVKPLHEHEGTNAQLSTTPEPNLSEVPAGPENPLPPLRQLTHTDPSPLLAVHLVDVLYSYCFTLRLYNGDWHSDPFGAATAILSVSKVLVEDARPETVAEALGACLEQTCSAVYRHTGGFRFCIGLLDDIISLLHLGCSALICSLCDLQGLIQAGERVIKSEKMGKAERGKSSRKLHSAERKVYFLMCWVHDQPGEAWSSLAGIVEVEKASLLESGYSGKPVKAERKAAPQTKVLIEEV